MEVRKLLAAYDGSNQSQNAYRASVRLAQEHGAELIVLAVVIPPEPAWIGMAEAGREYFEVAFRELKEWAEGVIPRFEVRVGHPAAQIVALAEKEGVDLIVMGCHGASLLQDRGLGSIVERVLIHAHCNVLVVH